jgi:murein endopeptidase
MLLPRRTLLLPLLCLGLLPLPALGQGKTYVIKGMGTHYTKVGKGIRKARPHKKVPMVLLKTGPGFVTANEERSWGTRLAVDEIRRAMAAFDKAFPRAQPIIVGDLSKRGGGVLDNHNSHLDGRDVDVHLPLNPVADISDKRPRTVNLAHTWFLLKAFADGCVVEYIFLDREVQRLLHAHALGEGVPRADVEMILQYPRSEKKAVGIVRHWTNHIDHFHVRFQRSSTPDGASKAYCDWKKAISGY